MSSPKNGPVIGAGLQAANRGAAMAKQQAAVRRRATVTPGKTLEMKATVQIWYKWGQGAENGEMALCDPVECGRQVINSKAAAATFHETVPLSFKGEHRHHVSIIVTFVEKTFGEFAQVELHARKYLRDADCASRTYKESIKYKTSEDKRDEGLSKRWYSGVIGFDVRVGGAEYGKMGTGEGKTISKRGGGTKVAPSGGVPSDESLDFEVFIKTIIQAPAASPGKTPEEIAQEKKRKMDQLKQVIGALFAILLFLASGAVFYPLVEGWSVLDSIYFGMVTITTVGYGDLCPKTVPGRIFTSFFVLGGVGIIGVALGIVGGYIIEQQQKIQQQIVKRAQALALAEHDSDSESSDSEGEGRSTSSIAAISSAQLKAKLQKSQVGCLYRFAKRWLKVFLPVIFTLSLGLVFFSNNEPYDPELGDCGKGSDNQTYYCVESDDGRVLYNDTKTYKMTFVNAMYFGLVTGTTVGYGDTSPSTDEGKIFCCFFLIFAVITTANALSTMGDALIPSAGADQASNILDNRLTADFLLSLDMDGSGDVTEYEYLSAMLIRLNHVDEHQIDSIMKAFRKLDVDGSGSLSVKDLAGSLKSERRKKKAEMKALEEAEKPSREEADANKAWAPDPATETK